MNEGGLMKKSEKQFIKYRKLPVTVEAYRTDEEIIIETLEGTIKAEKGDYIIKGVNGELYPCKPDIFHETYEKVYEKSNHQNNYCIDCKHCIGEPAILVSEDTGLWAMAYSCLGGNPKKKGMFTCKEKACEFFEEGVKC